MSYDWKRTNETVWDEAKPGEDLLVWFDPRGADTFTLPGITFRPGVEIWWWEMHDAVGLVMRTVEERPDGAGPEQVNFQQLLSKYVLKYDGALYHFIDSTVSGWDKEMRKRWLKVKGREDVDQSKG